MRSFYWIIRQIGYFGTVGDCCLMLISVLEVKMLRVHSGLVTKSG